MAEGGNLKNKEGEQDIKLWNRTRTYRVILLFAALSAALYLTPVQHYMSIARYQHYGIAAFIAGLGFILEVIWSWRFFSRWGRASVFGTGLFFASVGLVYYANPGLDPRIGVETDATDAFKEQLFIFYLSLSFILFSIWMKWIYEENKKKPPAPSKEKSTPSSQG